MSCAVLISGQPRFCRDFDLFLANLQPSCDFYFHLWSINNLRDRDKWDDSRHYISSQWRSIQAEKARDMIQARIGHHHLESLEFSDCYQYPLPQIDHANKEGLVFMWLGWKRVYDDLISRGKTYQYIFKARPDIGLSGSFDPSSLDTSIGLHVPNIGWHGHNHKINDLCAVGSIDHISEYLTLIDHVEHYHKNKSCTLHPETVLAYHLSIKKISVHKAPIPYTFRSYWKNTNDIDWGTWDQAQ